MIINVYNESMVKQHESELILSKFCGSILDKIDQIPGSDSLSI